MCFGLIKKDKDTFPQEEAIKENEIVVDFYVTTIRDLLIKNSKDLQELIEMLHLPLYNEETIGCVEESIINFLSPLQEDLTVVVEKHYVDRLYRDSYYYMYSKMGLGYSRYCLRLSFLDCRIHKDNQIEYKHISRFREAYFGFLVLRPLFKRCIGRNVISPKALKNRGSGISICEVKVPTSVCGIAVSVTGFPHCSQDMETMSCAESTLWAIMEYYAYKSPLYRLLLPSDIHSVLADTSKERQIPSHGLLFDQLSTVLHHCGFECVIYSKADWNNEYIEFKEVFSCYVESGIPLAVCIKAEDQDNHAVVCIGKQTTDPKNILKNNPMGSVQLAWCFNRWNQCLDGFVFSDDNRTCYQTTIFDKPVSYYDNPEEWGDGEITHFIAPLPNKVYLDAKSAIAISNSILANLLDLPKGTCVRTFLASCQSYRDFVVCESDWSDEDKNHFVGLKMPRHIWVTEFSDFEHFKNDEVQGILILDATGQEDISSVIYYRTKDSVMYYDERTKDMAPFEKTDGKTIKSYHKNLNNY